jgi:hypothetical protein
MKNQRKSKTNLSLIFPMNTILSEYYDRVLLSNLFSYDERSYRQVLYTSCYCISVGTGGCTQLGTRVTRWLYRLQSQCRQSHIRQLGMARVDSLYPRVTLCCIHAIPAIVWLLPRARL